MATAQRRAGDSWWPRPRLLQRAEAPQHRSFNSFILGGYLPPLTLSGCLHSLLYVHNETGNILTHALPLMFIVTCSLYWGSWQGFNAPLVKGLVIVLLALPWAASTVYHILMPHHGGPPVYQALLRLDMVSICLAVCLGPLPHVYMASLGLASAEARVVLVLVYCHTCLYSLIRGMTAVTIWQCRTCFGPPVLVVVVCWLLRVSSWSTGHSEGATFVPPMIALFVLGGLFGATFVPERWAAGRVDLICSSHQIMHVLVVAAQYCMFRSALTDLRWLMHNAL